MVDTSCPANVACKRGYDLMQWPAGADCSTPRIMYIHGGSWSYGSPFNDDSFFYYVHTSKIADSSKAVVMSIDYPLIGSWAYEKHEYIGNFEGIQAHAKAAWEWLGGHGPNQAVCKSPPPPMFLAGDSSGGGSALSFLLWLNREDIKGTRPPKLPMPSGGFFESPWTNLLSNSPSYYSNNAVFYPNKEKATQGIWTKSSGAANASTASIAGDILYNNVTAGESTNNPSIVSIEYAVNGLEYCGNCYADLSQECKSCFNAVANCTECVLPASCGSDKQFGDLSYLSCLDSKLDHTAPIDQLKSPLASPFWAKPEFFKGLPPIYFATSATELLAADTSVIAQNAGIVGVKVTSELFYGMWHTFPQYSEGCGLKKEEPDAEGLWQGQTAILHYGDFVKEVVRATRVCPGKLRSTGFEYGPYGWASQHWQDPTDDTRRVNSLRPLAGTIYGDSPVPLEPLRLNLCEG